MPVGVRRSLSAVVVSLCVWVGGLALGSVPALAVEAPEAPAPVAVGSLTETSAVFQGELNPGKSGSEPGSYELDTYEFLYKKSPHECVGESRAPEPPGMSLGKGTEALAPLEVSSLEAHTEYTVCLLARNGTGEEAVGPAVTFKTLPVAPTIASESVEDVEASAATLRAEIVPGGAETTYRFEYGASEAYGQSTPESASIGADDTAHAATARVTGLQPATTYHYRVVAGNECEAGKECVIDGRDKTLTTPAALGSAPPQHCENEKLRLEQPYGAGLPDCRAYEMVSPVETNGNDATEPFISFGARAAVSGEAVTYESRGSFADATGSNIENQMLSRRGPGGWSTQDIAPPMDPSRAEDFPSYRNLVFSPELTEGVAGTNAQLTGEAAPSEVNVWELYISDFASGSYQYLGEGVFWGPHPHGHEQGLEVVGASADFSHVVFTGGGTRGTPNDFFLFEWVNGKVWPVSVTNSGASMEASAEGSHAVSADGSRVFFASGGQVYVRENTEREQSAVGAKGECTEAAKACTVAISAGAAQFQGAGADGSVVFFTEDEELDEYDVESGQTTGLGGTVQSVVGLSEDGSYVYFLATGVLKGAGGEALRNSVGGEPIAGEENLYVSHVGTIQFIAAATGSGVVSPDGSYFAFTSYGSVTGYDNVQAEPGECGGSESASCQEVYLYDAATGSLECASCDPTGAQPVGSSTPGAVAEDGALFFDSPDALVPHASDGRENVYEYEDGHVDAVSNVAGGYESFFLAAGVNGDNVFFGTADQLLPEDTSDNVAVWDARVDGGFPVSVSPPPCDNGDSCKPPPTPQPAVFGAPASATFSGAGNITPAPFAQTPRKTAKKAVRCAKGRQLSHGRCVTKRKRPKRSRAKKSNHGKGSN
jgi:hypothetical protein